MVLVFISLELYLIDKMNIIFRVLWYNFQLNVNFTDFHLAKYPDRKKTIIKVSHMLHFAVDKTFSNFFRNMKKVKIIIGFIIRSSCLFFHQYTCLR